MILVHLSVEEIKKYINKNDLTEEYLLWLEKATQHLDDCAICRKRVQEAILIEEMCEENNIVLAGLNKGVDTEQKKIYSGAKNTHELKVTPNGFTSDPFYGHFCIINNMYECLTEKPEETINVSAILEAAYLSAESGHEITIKK